MPSVVRKLLHSTSRHAIGKLIINACIAAVTLLLLLLVVHDLFSGSGMRMRLLIGCAALAYLGVVRLLFAAHKEQGAYWMLLCFFASIALLTIFYWGINTTSGILTIGLTVILSGTLLGAKYIPGIVGTLTIALIGIQTLHQTGVYTPDLNHLRQYGSFGDVITYVIILSAFTLAIWLSMRRSEYALKRARQAEEKLRRQKEKLKLQLAQESAKLRAKQLVEMQQLYNFTVLGQNTAATLHELSNHLSVLGLEIEELRDGNQISKAVSDVEESFAQITAMITTVRRRLNTYDSKQIIAAYPVIRKAVEDSTSLLQNSGVHISYSTSDESDKKVRIQGDALALSHILSILIKNGVEACAGFPNARVLIAIRQTPTLLRITVTDNGIGLPEEQASSLFMPTKSTKPTGLGAGLYIAQGLAKSQFRSSLRLASNGVSNEDKGYLSGATFTLDIPIVRIANE